MEQGFMEGHRDFHRSLHRSLPTPISPGLDYDPTPPILDPSYPPHLSGRVVQHQEVWDSSNCSSVESKERLEASYARHDKFLAEVALERARWTVEEAARRIEEWLQEGEEAERREEELVHWWRWCTSGRAAWVRLDNPPFQGGVPTGPWRPATIVQVVDRRHNYIPAAAHLPGWYAVEVQLDPPGNAFGPVRWWLPLMYQFLQPCDSWSPPSWTDHNPLGL